MEEVPRTAMPLFEYRCGKCAAVTEVLRLARDKGRVTCARCGSAAMKKVVSRVSFQIASRPKYSEDFLAKAKPFLKSKRETAQYMAEGKGSEDAKTFRLAERIGERIDRTLAKVTKTARRGT
jgi:putative FmdB family regulatory protein